LLQLASEENEEERMELLRHQRLENNTCDDTDSIIIVIEGKNTRGQGWNVQG